MSAEDEAEYLKLPVEDRCVHKNWKARVSGYEECKTLFVRVRKMKGGKESEIFIFQAAI